MEKIWLVIEYGGEYEDKWEHILYAFHTKEEAEQFEKEWNEEQIKDVLDEELWWKLYDEISDDFCDDMFDAELIHKLHPEYSLEVLKKTDNFYFNDQSDVYIKEVNFKN